MFLDWLSGLFMSCTSAMAFETAVYSAGLPSSRGIYQMKEPERLQEIAEQHRLSAE